MTLGNINLRLILVVPIIFFLFFFVHNLQASDYVSSVRSYQEGKNIVITYALSKQSDIAVSVSTDGGRTYKTLISVYGDVGNMIKPGSKKIVWDVLSEYDNFKFFEVCFKVESNFCNGHEFVDLGLPSGTLWATCNIGASKPEEYGYYFAWGETSTKLSYISSNYSYSGKLKKLSLKNDAANANWGGSWRMPTKAEQEELRNSSYTIWTWISQKGVNGYKVTSKINGKSIFLPAAGYRYNSDLTNPGSYGGYWSSSLEINYSKTSYALSFLVGNIYLHHYDFCTGRSVRPVLNR